MENVLNRICSGLIALKYDGKTYYYSHPSSKDQYKADLVEQEILESNDDVMTSSDSIDLLTSMGKWSASKEKEISEEIPKILEDIKTQIYVAYIRRPEEIEPLKLKLKKVKDYLYSLLSEKHSYDTYNISSLAKKARTLYLIKKCVKGIDVKPHLLLNPLYSAYLDESSIRKTARSEEWTIKWLAMKNGAKVFSGNLSEEQERLIKWTTIYESVMESQEPPPIEVLNDDDALDGYFLYKRIENKDKRILEDLEARYASKGVKYTELYLPAKDMKEAMQNDALNTEQARNIKKARFAQVNASEGVVKEADFRDQRIKLNIAKNQF